MAELYNSTMQMWTKLQEDEKIQELDQKEGNINTAVQDLKHKHKNMAILDRMKSAQEMKNLQAELKSIQMEKQLRQAQLEPLQEGEEMMITELEATKGRIEKLHLESVEVLKEHITTQLVENIAERSAQEKAQVQELTGRFQALKKSVQEENTA
jgi:hypothetical protein